LDEQHQIIDIVEDHLFRLDAANALLRTSIARTEAMLTAGLWRATHTLDRAATVTLESVADVRLGRQRSPKNHSGDRMRPYLRAANVDWDELRLADVKEMQFTEAEERIYRLQLDDILLTEASGSPAEVGKSAIYRGDPSDVCFQNTLLRVRCHSANPEFVQKYLLAEARAGRFMPESRGVGINHLGRARLAALRIERPTPAQQTIAVDACRELVGDIGRMRSALEDQMTRSTALRHAILSAAFSGRLTSA
jgi:type I restriction enzyme S subunit